MALRTPLYDRHVAAGARMVEFGGFDMPLQYSTIREEHIAVRTRCGLFDLSHMGEVRFSGDRALDVVQRLVTNDVARLEVGGALYGVMCNDAGGIVDDVVVYREAGGYMVVINAACRPKDVAWMGGHSSECTFEDVGDSVALLAVQGPWGWSVASPPPTSPTFGRFIPLTPQSEAFRPRCREPATRVRTALSSTSTLPMPPVSGTRSSKQELQTA